MKESDRVVIEASLIAAVTHKKDLKTILAAIKQKFPEVTDKELTESLKKVKSIYQKKGSDFKDSMKYYLTGYQTKEPLGWTTLTNRVLEMWPWKSSIVDTKNPVVGSSEYSKIDLRKGYDEKANVDFNGPGVLYRKDNIVQVWWKGKGKGPTIFVHETWIAPDEKQAKREYESMKDRWKK